MYVYSFVEEEKCELLWSDGDSVFSAVKVVLRWILRAARIGNILLDVSNLYPIQLGRKLRCHRNLNFRKVYSFNIVIVHVDHEYTLQLVDFLIIFRISRRIVFICAYIEFLHCQPVNGFCDVVVCIRVSYSGYPVCYILYFSSGPLGKAYSHRVSWKAIIQNILCLVGQGDKNIRFKHSVYTASFKEMHFEGCFSKWDLIHAKNSY